MYAYILGIKVNISIIMTLTLIKIKNSVFQQCSMFSDTGNVYTNTRGFIIQIVNHGMHFKPFSPTVAMLESHCLNLIVLDLFGKTSNCTVEVMQMTNEVLMYDYAIMVSNIS